MLACKGQMKVFSVFVRYFNEEEIESSFETHADIKTEEYLGSYDSRDAAEHAARAVNITQYCMLEKEWQPSVADAWTTFSFVFESKMNHPVKSGSVTGLADNISSDIHSAWMKSPAGLENAERIRQLHIERETQRQIEKERKAAVQREIQDRINAKSRATRAANKAARMAATV